MFAFYKTISDVNFRPFSFKKREMKFMLLFLVGVLAIFKTASCSVSFDLATVPEENDKNQDIFDSPAYKITSHLSSADLKAIHRKAKSISHSKGHIVNIEGKDPEYRRSLIRKIELKTKSHALRKVIKYLLNSNSDMIRALEALELLVHQYDTAIDFMNLGGMEIILPLAQIDDEEVASVALSVMTAAMQGNPIVQRIAVENRALDVLLAYLVGKNRHSLPGILFAVSSFLRNMPDSQMSFFRRGGVSLLADIVKNQNNTVKYRLHAVTILTDLAVEIFGDENMNNQKLKLQKTFSSAIDGTDVCEKIPGFLNCDEYLIHEKIVSAMNALHKVCFSEFQRRQVRNTIKELIRQYDPYPMEPWYSKSDQELKWTLYVELKAFDKKKPPMNKYLRKVEL